MTEPIFRSFGPTGPRERAFKQALTRAINKCRTQTAYNRLATRVGKEALARQNEQQTTV